MWVNTQNIRFPVRTHKIYTKFLDHSLISNPEILGIKNPSDKNSKTQNNVITITLMTYEYNKHCLSTILFSKMSGKLMLRAFFTHIWFVREAADRYVSILFNTPGMEYVCMRLVKHRSWNKYRIYGVIARTSPFPSKYGSEGYFSFRYRKANSVKQNDFFVRECITLKMPNERRQKLRFKVKGRVQYARPFILWLLSGKDKIEIGNKQLLMKEFNVIKALTEKEAENGNCGYGRFPIICNLRKDIK